MSDSFDNGTTEWFVCSPLGLTAEREQGPYQANAAINVIQLNNCSQNKQSYNMDCLVSISLQLANSRQRTLEFEWFVYNSHCCCTLELPMSFIKKKMGDRVDSRCRGGMIIPLFSFLSGYLPDLCWSSRMLEKKKKKDHCGPTRVTLKCINNQGAMVEICARNEQGMFNGT